MYLEQVLFIGKLAAVTSILTFIGGIIIQTKGVNSDLVDIIGGLISTFLWVLFAYGNTNIEKAVGGSVVHTSDPALSFLGVGLAGVMVVVSLFGTVSVIDVRHLAQQNP